ncbi:MULTISPECIES: sulfatase [Micrococcaceae]|uniref:sulfatase n=1 Tax=Micrococcaceae TaxID=1268 RepID=UPI0006FE3347|nr:sulfatase [Arthrobacter sp. Soil761]KRE65482.1 sulfatase [Arthrobacter sp. Soil761]
MKAIMVLFDSLNRRFLPPYGGDWVHAPNFERLASRSVAFETCYAGSMPCMPARRELHTGRYNFLHRSWGPLEPFDDSVPEMLSQSGVYSHLVTDHQHYWEDGGATYHNRFDSYEFFRGQEGDAWKGHVDDPEDVAGPRVLRHQLWRQDLINRQYLTREEDHPQTKTIGAGLEFIETNHASGKPWFLQIECFDPHEPFFSYAQHKEHYAVPALEEGERFDWPDYKRVAESPDEVEHARSEYAALLSMCDANLGRVLDAMDDHGLWDDTMLIVCTDHGFLLGEHGWWGKNVQPWYDENIHTPLFVWDPRNGSSGERRTELVQTVDLAPTLLEHFEVQPTPRMQGRSLSPVLRGDEPIRSAGLFGTFGGHVNITDGRYVYMRSCATQENMPLYEHTLMPTHMASRFAVSELVDAELVEPLPFTQGVPVLRLPGNPFGNPYSFGTLLFDLAKDPEQQNPLIDDDLELHMMRLLVNQLREADAPVSQYERLGLPITGDPGPEHLLAAAQRHLYEDARLPLAGSSEFRDEFPGVNTRLADLAANPLTKAVLVDHLGPVVDFLITNAATSTVVDIAALTPGLRYDRLKALDFALSAACEPAVK